MVDPLTGAAAGEVAKAGGGVLSRLLGPTADEMGVQLQEWYKRKNVERVARRAEAKAHTGREGAVPPRVAADIFDKAQWADDEFVAEYLSGVLASARTPGGRDDSAISWTALVGRLPASHLRLHYVLYSTARELMMGLPVGSINDIELSIYCPLEPVINALRPSNSSSMDEVGHSFNEGFTNLAREGLLGDRSVNADAGMSVLPEKIVPDRLGITYEVTYAGALLYLRGGGRRETLAGVFTSEGVELRFGDEVSEIPVPLEGAALVRDLPDREGSDISGPTPE